MNRLGKLAFALTLFCLPSAVAAAELPARINPSSPFPRILEQAPTVESIAPGVDYGDYQLSTEIGPIAVHVVAIDAHRSDVRIENVLADNSLESRGETVGSMAKRTRAVAGINGDYFDIGNTNRPLNIVVRNGELLAMPRKRYALALERDGTPQIAEFNFLGQVQIGDRTLSLDAMDELPAPNGGTSFLTPAYGNVRPQENTTLIALQPLNGTAPLARYRVSAIADNLSPQPAGYYVAVGPSAYNDFDVPSPGDVAEVTGDLSPLGLDRIETAIGGGPLILHNGAWNEDPDGPNGGEFAKRIPCSGAAIAPDGRLLLIEVDGRQPSISVGLTRPEFAALMRAFGASDGLAFDGGGSSTLAVRRLGDEESSVVNEPSDGVERPVGDGLFVYSTAPAGAPVRLVARPEVVRAVAGADVSLHIAAVDDAGHVAPNDAPLTAVVEPPSLGSFREDRFVAIAPGEGRVFFRSGRLAGEVSVEVVRAPARIAIFPADPNVDKGASIALRARAYDAHGYHLALPAALRWEANAGSIDEQGVYRVAGRDANVTVRVGDAVGFTRVTVGSHAVALPFAERAHFVTLPHGGQGSLERDPSCAACLKLNYVFAGDERAAYAMSDLPLPLHTIGVEFDVLDDGSASRLHIALRNSINEDVLLNATPLDQPGWRHVAVRWSNEGGEAAKLLAIYVLPPKGMEVASGQIELRNVRAVVAGE